MVIDKGVIIVQSNGAKDGVMKNPLAVQESSIPHHVEKERLNLYLPKALVEELRRVVPARARTQFVIDALDRELHRVRLKEALKASYGAWKEEDHPELATPEDIDHWIEEGRKTATRDWSAEWERDD
jgi:hypothetical protein